MSSAERFREIYEEKAMGAGLRIGGEGGCSECGGGGVRLGGAPKGYKACKKSKAISEKSGQKYYKHYAPKGKEHGKECSELKTKRQPKKKEYGPGKKDNKMYSSAWQLYIANKYYSQNQLSYRDFLKTKVSQPEFKSKYIKWLSKNYPAEYKKKEDALLAHYDKK